MTPAWIHTLERLQSEGSLAASAVPRGIRKSLEDWGERTGCLRLVREGRGVSLRVERPEVIENELSRCGSGQDHSTAPQRAQNLARYRDTKVGASGLATTYYLLKAVGEGVLASTGRGEGICLSDVSRSGACVGLALEGADSPGWDCPEELLLVENQLLFDDLSWLPDGWCGVVLHYAGVLSVKLLDWLARSRFRAVTLFPDYDGVGLQNFARLREALPSCTWYWVAEWEQALERYGNSTLWDRGEQRKIVDELWSNWGAEGWPDPQFRVLMGRMRALGVMLEQEWVLLGGCTRRLAT